MLNDLTFPQRELAEYMSALSERAYGASWMDGLEFALWEAVVNSPFKYGRLDLTPEHQQRLIELSESCGGWIIFEEKREETFVSIAEWKQRFSSVEKDR